MTGERALRLWIAALLLAGATLFLALLVLALAPDAPGPLRDHDFEQAMADSDAAAAEARDAAATWRIIVPLGLAVGLPIGTGIAGLVAYGRYRSQLSEGR